MPATITQTFSKILKVFCGQCRYTWYGVSAHQVQGKLSLDQYKGYQMTTKFKAGQAVQWRGLSCTVETVGEHGYRVSIDAMGGSGWFFVDFEESEILTAV